MANVLEMFESLGTAYSKRTIQLLQNERSRIYIAIFKSLFPDTSKPMAAQELWARVDESLAALDEAGYTDLLPVEEGKLKTGRAICKDLIDRYNWLESTVLADGQTQFRLTSDATEALGLIDRLNSTETLMSESRMRTLVEAIEAAAVLFSPDYEAGLAVLRNRVEAARAQLEEYERNGGSEPLAPERARMEVANILDLMSQLPYDLRRLEEDVHARANGLIEEFRDDERPAGQIIGRYIDASRALVSGTDHGRCFLDAVRVVGDPGVAASIDEQLDTIANAAVFESTSWEQSRRLQRGWSQISQGISDVNGENRRASHVIGRAIAQHDVARDRELTRLLKELEGAAYRWAADVPKTQRAPFETTIQAWDVKTLQRSPWSPERDAPPPQLAPTERDAEPPTLEELRVLGGPLTAEILDAIADAAPPHAKQLDLAAGFNALPAAMRRPAEIVGLVQLATSLGIGRNLTDDLVGYVCVGLDGRTAIWRGPRITITRDDMNRQRKGVCQQ